MLALVSIFRPFPVVRAAAAVFCAMFLALCLSQPDVWLRAANRQLAAAGVRPDLVRMSCGLEDKADLIADIAQALDKI